jgi:hypothetical protein
MDWKKVDASLAGALGDVEDPEVPEFDVFVHLANDPDSTESASLQRFGVRGVAPGRKIITAKLSARAIDELSDQPSVSSVSLSRRLKVLGKR